ncbi:hypothetical protein IEQ34_003464 [Dendrobium chrysotoxum]|uniref:Uncharacterized protein n=1 Tax=Dendrobium chrysotoxum TaxID=161865 RepID=A0AAV7HHB7_DENCH|nr:hypothetical protein IEQ34_003464 [Dendrobium chrysotoxum]
MVVETNANSQNNIEDPLTADNEPVSTNGDDPISIQGVINRTNICLDNGSRNVDESMVVVTSKQNIVTTSSFILCVINKNLSDLDFMMNNKACANTLSFQTVVNEHDKALGGSKDDR